MTILQGKIVSVDEHRMARVSIRGAVWRVSTELLPDVRPDDQVLIEGGVAVSLVQTTEEKENNDVPGNSRKSS